MTRPTDYTKFQERLEEVFNSKGMVVLPHVKEITDPAEALKAISVCSKSMSSPYELRVMNLDPPVGAQTHIKAWYPKIFLNTGGMAGRFDGSGVILVGGYPHARAFSFSMCEHEWDESGANHSRGWHPKRCTKCGFDASIDSGD